MLLEGIIYQRKHCSCLRQCSQMYFSKAAFIFSNRQWDESHGLTSQSFIVEWAFWAFWNNCLLSWCFPALQHPRMLLTKVFEDGQLSYPACILSKAQPGVCGDNAKPQTFLQKNISEQRQHWYRGFREVFDMAGLNVAGSQKCHNVLASTPQLIVEAVYKHYSLLLTDFFVEKPKKQQDCIPICFQK